MARTATLSSRWLGQHIRAHGGAMTVTVGTVIIG
jgi:hypothetical protein